MKKLFLLFLIAGTILPSFTSIPSAEAGSSPEGVPRRPRNFSPEGRHRPRKKCTIRRPCVPQGYYRPTPPPFIIGG